MRPVFKYIFCGLILAVLIFIAFCVFYIANTYAISERNKHKPIFGEDKGPYFAGVAYYAISEIEDIQPEFTPSGGEESPGGSITEYSEPSGGLPAYEPEDEPEEEPESEEEPEDMQTSENDVGAATPDNENDIMQDNELEESERLKTVDSDAYSENGGSYVENDLLYSILVEIKINQYITTFVLAVALIIIIFRPICKAFFDEPFGF